MYSNRRSHSGSSTSSRSSSSSSSSDDFQNKSKCRQNRKKSVDRKRSSSNLSIQSHSTKKSKSHSNRTNSKYRPCSENHEISSDGSTASYQNEYGRRRRSRSNFSELTSNRSYEYESHDRLPEDDPKASRILYIGNLDISMTTRKLDTILERYGNVLRIDLRKGKFGTERMYAFAKLLTLDMAYNAKVALSGQFITKFRCKIGYGKQTPTARIWVGGLSASTTTSQIKIEFRQFGEIKRIDRIEGDNQCYIWYDSVKTASTAVRKMRGFSFAGSTRRLRTDFADVPPNDLENRQSTSEESHNSKTVELLKKCCTAHEIIENCSMVWQGDILLKSLPHTVAMHLIEGSKDIVEELMKKEDGELQLSISQEYDLSQFKFDEVQKGLSSGSSHAIFLGCPVESEPFSVRKFVSYLKEGKAIGAVYLMNEETLSYGILFIFPPCSFSIDLLKRNCPHLVEESITEDYLIMIALRGY